MTPVTFSTRLAKAASWPDRYPGFAFILLIVLAVLGMVLAARSSVGNPPAHAPSVLGVRAELPGIDAETIESLITRPMQDALEIAPGVQTIEARTRTGRAEIVLRFESDQKREAVLELVRRRVAEVQLPAGMEAPVVEARDEAQPAAAIYAVTAERLTGETARWVERMLAAPLRELPEIATASVEGARESEIVIRPDTRRLAAFGLSFDHLIQALRRTDEAPKRKRARRPTVVLPGSAEAITARAVILPSGEPIALGEVASATTVTIDPPSRPRFGDAPALLLQVYPRVDANASYVADRANAHFAWLRANDLIPNDIVVHALHNHAQSTRQSLKQLLRRGGTFLVVTLIVCALALGIRRAGLMVSACIVWLPVTGAALWMSGFSLNAMVVAGLVIACVVFAAMVLLPPFLRVALVALVAAAAAWLLSSVIGAYSPIATACALAIAVAIVVAWLLTPWSQARSQVTPFAVRLLPKKTRTRWRPVSATLLIAGMLIAGVAATYTLLTARATQASGTLVIRLQGEKSSDLTVLAQKKIETLQRTPGIETVSLSGEPVETWRIELDEARMGELGLTLPEIGRALAIAQDGLVVGRSVQGETVLPLRIQLPAGSAGDQFERLLLRGEQKRQPAIYFRDVGIALRELQPREIIELDDEPTVEIVARWTTREARDALELIYKELSLTQDVVASAEQRPE